MYGSRISGSDLGMLLSRHLKKFQNAHPHQDKSEFYASTYNPISYCCTFYRFYPTILCYACVSL